MKIKELILKSLSDNTVLKEAQLSLNVMSMFGPGRFDSVDYFQILDELIHTGQVQVRYYSVNDKVYRIYYDSKVRIMDGPSNTKETSQINSQTVEESVKR